jgi:hypothetical protein
LGTGKNVALEDFQSLYDLGLTENQAKWSYQVQTLSGRTRTLSLDGRIELASLGNETQKERVSDWLYQVADYLDIDSTISQTLLGTRNETEDGSNL